MGNNCGAAACECTWYSPGYEKDWYANERHVLLRRLVPCSRIYEAHVSITDGNLHC